MKKLFKGLFAGLLAVGLLAACKPAVTHTVTFWADNVGAFYEEVEVKDGAKVARPATDPTRNKFTFADWWADDQYTAKFDFEQPIKADTDVYGKWEPVFEPDTRTFHLVGDMQNTDVSYINWNASGTEGVEWDVRSYLEKVEPEKNNLYAIEIEIGYLGKFKVKVPGTPWDGGQEFDFTHVAEADRHEYLQEGDTRNIQVKTAGKYRIEVETTYLWAKVTRLGDAVGEGVKQDPDPNAIVNWGIVGTPNDWGNGGVLDTPLKYNLEGAYYYLEAFYLAEGAEFKLRADNSWGMEYGSSVNNEIATTIIQATELLPEATEETIKEGGNLKVDVGGAGHYSFYFINNETEKKLVIQKLAFALRGTALETTGWDADSTPLAEKSVAELEGVYTYEYESVYTFVVGEFKAKMAAVGQFSGWDVAFGGEGGANLAVAAAGDYTVTLQVVITAGEEGLTFTGTLAFAPAVI